MQLRGPLFFACAVALWPRAAGAIRYELFIDVETEEELYDLYLTGQISDASFDALLLLHQSPIDLNQATRQDLYRLPNLDYQDVDRVLSYREAEGPVFFVEELVAAHVLDASVASSLRAFISLRATDDGKGRIDGFLRTQLAWTGRHDRLPPPVALQARLRGLDRLEAGVVGTLVRNRVRRPRWDSVRQGFSVAPEAARFLVPKAYVKWEDDRLNVVAGTYRVGFGQRLTFDVTGQATPNGLFGDYELRRGGDLAVRCRRGAGELPSSPCPEAYAARVTPDFAWTNRLTGVGVGVKRLPVGRGWLQGYVWGSYQVHRVLAGEIALATCDDRRDNADSSCDTLPVFVRGPNPLAPAASVSQASLPAAVAEALGGTNLTYFWSARRHFGVTGYGAFPRWRIHGVALDFREHARKPFGGPFGAIGLDAALGSRHQDFFVELSRSFDRQAGGGGGYAAIVRSVTTLPVGEIDISLRYYDSSYANPYAHPPSAPDELDGLAARDEVGARARVALELGPNFTLRALADTWRRLTRSGLGTRLFARTDAQMGGAWSAAFWFEHQSAARKATWAILLAFAPRPSVELSWQLQHRSLDAALSNLRRQHDLGSILHLTARPSGWMRLRLRVRYDYEDVADRHRLSQALWSSLDCRFAWRGSSSLRLRYDLRAHLDERKSTQRRVPNPEHWLWLEHVFRY